MIFGDDSIENTATSAISFKDNNLTTTGTFDSEVTMTLLVQ